MPAASMNHNRISSNLLGRTWNHFLQYLRQRFAHLRKMENSYFYTDAVIVCGEPEFDDEKIKDTLKNPVVIFEILSSSEDVGKKLMYYMQIQSLKQYIIIDSTKINVRVITRRLEEGTWKFSELMMAEETLFIEPVDLGINVGDLYEGVNL